MYLGLHKKYPFLLSDLMKFEFCQEIFEKNTKILNFMKTRSMGAELFLADGQT